MPWSDSSRDSRGEGDIALAHRPLQDRLPGRPGHVGDLAARRHVSYSRGLLEGGVPGAVGLAVEAGGDQDLGRHRLAVEVGGDVPRRLAADAVGILDRVGVELAVLDGLLPLGLAVEADDRDAARLAGLFE